LTSATTKWIAGVCDRIPNGVWIVVAVVFGIAKTAKTTKTDEHHCKSPLTLAFAEVG
jgi:hypothetical protein